MYTRFTHETYPTRADLDDVHYHIWNKAGEPFLYSRNHKNGEGKSSCSPDCYRTISFGHTISRKFLPKNYYSLVSDLGRFWGLMPGRAAGSRAQRTTPLPGLSIPTSRACTGVFPASSSRRRARRRDRPMPSTRSASRRRRPRPTRAAAPSARGRGPPRPACSRPSTCLALSSCCP